MSRDFFDPTPEQQNVVLIDTGTVLNFHSRTSSIGWRDRIRAWRITYSRRRPGACSVAQRLREKRSWNGCPMLDFSAVFNCSRCREWYVRNPEAGPSGRMQALLLEHSNKSTGGHCGGHHSWIDGTGTRGTTYRL